jgi:hypothetical protein
MLNIRINLTINLKKVTYAGAAMMIALSHVVTPAYALQASTVPTVKEKPVTVSLAYLKVQTTRSQARASITSNQAKYFDAEALTFLTVYSNGWSMSEWKCLQYVWKNESHFNPKALNKHSGAFGIAQFLPSTWGNYKVTQTQSAQLQVKYGLRYIEKRYGSACGAKAFWIKHGWY